VVQFGVPPCDFRHEKLKPDRDPLVALAAARKVWPVAHTRVHSTRRKRVRSSCGPSARPSPRRTVEIDETKPPAFHFEVGATGHPTEAEE
jgi:hypothetical protein